MRAPALPSFLVAATFIALSSAATENPARADATIERARIHLQAGIAYYDEARYDEAAREMEAAYRLKPLPELQYNLAQCYERLGRTEAAVSAYQRYLADKPGADDHAVIEARVANLQQRLHEAAAPVSPAVEPAPATEKVVFKTIVIYRDAPPPPGRGARIAAYGAGVLALGALGAGITSAVLVSNAARDVQAGANPAAPPTFDGHPRDAQNLGQTLEVLTFVSFGVAALAAVSAVSLYAFGAKIDREARPVTLAPALSPTGGGLYASGAF